MLVKENNLPPGKRAMGHDFDLHLGSDSHVRVTQTGIIKRSIIVKRKDAKNIIPTLFTMLITMFTFLTKVHTWRGQRQRRYTERSHYKFRIWPINLLSLTRCNVNDTWREDIRSLLQFYYLLDIYISTGLLQGCVLQSTDFIIYSQYEYNR